MARENPVLPVVFDPVIQVEDNPLRVHDPDIAISDFGTLVDTVVPLHDFTISSRLVCESAWPVAARPVLNISPMSSGAEVAVDVVCDLGWSYQFEVSTNLADWVPLGCFEGTNAIIQLHDSPPPGEKQRFYRVTVP